MQARRSRRSNDADRGRLRSAHRAVEQSITGSGGISASRQGAMTFLRIVVPRHLFDVSMIAAQTRSADVARENRHPRCANAALRVRIMR